MQANGIGLDAFFDSAHSGLGLYAALPDGVSITFELSGEGGGVWSVVRDEEGSVAVSRRAVSRPDCRLAHLQSAVGVGQQQHGQCPPVAVHPLITLQALAFLS